MDATRQGLDVAAIGEVLVDFTPADFGGETGFLPKPGGAPANVAAAVSRLGGSSAFVGKVGSDRFGDFLKHSLASGGVDISALVTDESAPTTLAFVHLDESGERDFSFYREFSADTRLEASELVLDVFDACIVAHFGSVSLSASPSREATLQAVRYAKQKGKLVSFDPNYRPLLWKREADAVSAMGEGLRYADIVKVSQGEMRLIAGTDDLEEGSARLAEHGAKLVVVTLGSLGSFFWHRGKTLSVSAPNVAATDTNGAGDAFLGGLLYCICRKGFGMAFGEMEKAVMFANACGAIATTRPGAMSALPTLGEVKSILGEGMLDIGDNERSG